MGAKLRNIPMTGLQISVLSLVYNIYCDVLDLKFRVVHICVGCIRLNTLIPAQQTDKSNSGHETCVLWKRKVESTYAFVRGRPNLYSGRRHYDRSQFTKISLAAQARKRGLGLSHRISNTIVPRGC